jgi:hypothetical protein
MSDYRIIDADGHVMELDERDQRDFSQDIPALIGRPDITDEAKRRIFFDNPLRFYPRLRARVDKQPLLAAAVQGAVR